VVCTMLAYRRIESVGRWGTLFGAIILIAGAWIVVDAVRHGRAGNLAWPRDALASPKGFVVGLGGATLFAMYDFMGYQTVCFVGGEVRQPERTIPRSVVLAIVVVASLYLAMNIGILSVMPWQTAVESKYIVSDFIAMLHGRATGVLMTVLILIITLAGVFAGMVGASRVPYAAAARGDFFRGFAALDTSGHFPAFAVVYTGLATAICCLFPLDALIQAGTVIYILIQSIPVVIAVPLLRSRRPDVVRPFQMKLYPLPVVVALAGWLYILSTSGAMYFMIAVAVLLVGITAYLIRARRGADWPWLNPNPTG
jgi:amino acid transporter